MLLEHWNTHTMWREDANNPCTIAVIYLNYILHCWKHQTAFISKLPNFVRSTRITVNKTKQNQNED